MNRTSDEVYEILSKIGCGSYATVHKAINRQTGELFAIKKIPVTSEFDNLKNEIEILSNCCDCENIVRFSACACSEREVSIIMEYCCGGSAKDVMRQLGRTLTEEQIVVILRDVLKGLDYLHSKGKIHRDVKAANILLNEQGIAKLGDFGVSEPLDVSEKKRSIIGTLLWLAPEVLNQDPSYNHGIDIWSLGITAIEMAEGQPPYSDLGQGAALREIANLEKPTPNLKETANWSSGLLDIISLCLDKDASKRKTAQELLKHDIFKSSLSNDPIKDLVAEVCSNAFRSREPESSLSRKSEQLIKESAILIGIYNQRRMKVIRVDQMTDLLKGVEKDFLALHEGILRRDSKIKDIRARSKVLEEELIKLERDRNELRSELKFQKERKQNILKQLSKIRDTRKRFENSN